MLNSDLNASLKYENLNLREDLVFYKSQNIYLHGKIQDMEDEIRILKEKLEKFAAPGKKTKENYQLGHHFPEKLLFPYRKGK